ncbi:MAG: chromosomal replication initiator protein DnaA [Lachnospiraceae bacterium]|nr:chromosomal replication initiator protein DnaA [Lachnospiraceae bacterium]
MEFLEENWTTVKENIRKEYELSEISYKTWILPLKFHKFENGIVTIIIPLDQSHALNYISNKYKSYFQVTISEMLDETVEISFILEKDVAQDSPENIAATPHYNIMSENANLNPKYKFDTFVVGSNNKFAHSAALAVAESPGEAYNPLFIYGGAGLGKTHLMHSIGHYILENNSSMKVLYVTSEQFTNEVIESIRSGNAAAMTKLREKYRTVDVLMIDDVQFIIGKESTQEEFFHTFNVLHDAGKQIILSSDRPPKEMQALEERYRSRFEWGLIADIQVPDYETRVAILQKNVESLDKKVDNSILEYIANNIQSNIRELEGAFNKIIAYSKINNIPLEKITLEHAEEALKDIISSSGSRDVNEELILKIVAEHFNVTPKDILSQKRDAQFSEPRQVVMYLCSTVTHTTAVGIAKLLNKKDHTTILHGIKKIREQLETDEELRNKVTVIQNIISPS